MYPAFPDAKKCGPQLPANVPLANVTFLVNELHQSETSMRCNRVEAVRISCSQERSLRCGHSARRRRRPSANVMIVAHDDELA